MVVAENQAGHATGPRARRTRCCVAAVVVAMVVLAGIAIIYPPPQYSFFVAGHAYGNPGTKRTGVYPPFRKAFETMRSDGSLAFGFLTGDAVCHATKQAFDALDADLAALPVDVLRIAGNHELKARPLFEARYGKTWHSFEHQGDQFIILDGMAAQWSITGEQLTFLKAALANSRAGRNVFVFVHQILWWDSGHEFLGKVRPNSTDGLGDAPNYWSVIHPLLREAGSEVYVFAGDVGAFPEQVAFQHHTDGNVHLILSGMGGASDDNYVRVAVFADGSVEIAKQPLPR